MLRDINDRHGVAGGLYLLGGALVTLLRQYPAAPVDIETRMHPATQHPGTREPLFEIATMEKLVHDLRDGRTQEAVAGLVALLVALQERVEMPRQALPERRGLGLPGTIDLLHHAAHLHLARGRAR